MHSFFTRKITSLGEYNHPQTWVPQDQSSKKVQDRLKVNENYEEISESMNVILYRTAKGDKDSE